LIIQEFSCLRNIKFSNFVNKIFLKFHNRHRFNAANRAARSSMSSSSSTSTTAAGFAFAGAGADCFGITLTAPAGIFFAGRAAAAGDDDTAGSAETDITGKLLGTPLVGCETTFFAPPPPPPKSGGGSGKSACAND
jgi:hypothetical protein